MTKKLLTSFVLTIIFAMQVYAQGRTVSGKVTDKKGEAIPGANIVVKGNTAIATVSSDNGTYSLANVPDNATVIITASLYIEIEIATGTNSVVNVTMNGDDELEAVTVTAYGDAGKRGITSSSSVVNGSVFSKLPMQSADRAMQGRLAGVQVNSSTGQPGGALNVRVRGVSSITAGNAPLYIIDGVQITNRETARIGNISSSNPLASINPADIESIEVLKDAASAAIYGAQAANGIVLVTTKRGKSGATKIDFNIQEGFVQPMRLYNVLNARQLATIAPEGYLNDGASPASATTQSANIFGNPNDPNLTDFNWRDATFRTARLSTYDMSFAGGDDKTTFYIAGSYNKTDAQVIASDWNRGTLKANFTNKTSDRLSLGLNLSLAVQNQKGAINGGNFISSPFFAAFLTRPNQSPYLPGGTLENPSAGGFNTAVSYFGFPFNQLQFAEQAVSKSNSVFIVSNMNATYSISKSLKAIGYIGVDFSQNRDEAYRPRTIAGSTAANGGTLTLINARNVGYNSNVGINYNKVFDKKHTVSIISGAEIKYEQFETVSATSFNFVRPSLYQLGLGSTLRPPGQQFTEYKRAGIFAQAKYDYKGKYFIDGTLRRDGSSRFGLDSRWGSFYAIAGAWALSEETFIKEGVPAISNLKLRASYGRVGNSNVGDFSYLGTYSGASPSGNSFAYLGQPALNVARLDNNLLGWESSYNTNIALDLGLLRNRFTISVDVWRRNNKDLLLDNPLAADAGIRSPEITQNIGEMRNQGIDLEIGATVIEGKKFKWITSFNNSWLSNKVISLGEGINYSLPLNAFVGEPINPILAQQFIGVNPATGRPMYEDKDGNMTYAPSQNYNKLDDLTQRGDYKIMGSRLPKYFGGWTNTFTYAGLSLDILWQYQVGNDVLIADFDNILNGTAGDANQDVRILDRWTKPGDVTNIPRLSQTGTIDGVLLSPNSQFSTRFLSDASYLRLKQVTLRYDLSSDILKDSKIFRSASVYVQAINLYTYTNFAGIDPEVSGNTSNGSTYNNFPSGRQFTIGVSFGL